MKKFFNEIKQQIVNGLQDLEEDIYGAVKDQGFMILKSRNYLSLKAPTLSFRREYSQRNIINIL